MMTGGSLILLIAVVFLVAHEVPIMPMMTAVSLITLALAVVILSYFADEWHHYSRKPKQGK